MWGGHPPPNPVTLDGEQWVLLPPNNESPSMNRYTISLLTLGGLCSLAAADGTEMLGTPSIPIADGTDVVIGGVGFAGGQPDSVSFDVPAGVNVLQVLLYWEGFALSAAEQGATDTIQVDFGAGFVNVTGDRIGGPSLFVPNLGLWTSTYRAEVDTGLVTTGNNTWPVQGLDFGFINNGLGAMVVIDDPSASSGIQLQDGNDGAYHNFAPPFDTTEVVEFVFPSADTDRSGALSHFVSSVSSQSSFGPDRTSIIQVGFDDDPFSVFLNDALGLNADTPPGGTHEYDGDWDILRHVITVPAFATKVRVQILSEDSGLGEFAGDEPASLVWVATAFTLEEEVPPPPGGEGCTPGFWKNHLDAWALTPYSPDDDFGVVFGTATFSGMTLHQVVSQGGGCKRALGRHAVAAILNASHPDIDYAIPDAGDIIDAVAAVIDGSDCDAIEDLKDILDAFNNAGCGLGNDDRR